MDMILEQEWEIRKRQLHSLLCFAVGAAIAFLLPWSIFIGISLWEWTLLPNPPHLFLTTVLWAQQAVLVPFLLYLLWRQIRPMITGFLLFSIPSAIACVHAYLHYIATFAPGG
jgi:hypothetical protein